MASSPSQTAAPPAIDVSHRAHNLARIVDRLSPGTYQLTIVKDDIHGVDWSIEIVRSELIQRVLLSNKITPRSDNGVDSNSRTDSP